VDAVAVGDHMALGFSSCGRCVPEWLAVLATANAYFPLNTSGQRADGTSPLSRARSGCERASPGRLRRSACCPL